MAALAALYRVAGVGKLSLIPQAPINTEYPFLIIEPTVTAVLLRGMLHSLQTDAFAWTFGGEFPQTITPYARNVGERTL